MSYEEDYKKKMIASAVKDLHSGVATPGQWSFLIRNDVIDREDYNRHANHLKLVHKNGQANMNDMDILADIGYLTRAETWDGSGVEYEVAPPKQDFPFTLWQ